MKTTTGGCVCGAVRYEFKGDSIAMFRCHCKTCQKVTGSAYTPVVLVLTKGFKLTKGSLSHYSTDNIKGGHNKRGFCPECGSRISGAESDRWLGLAASSLDDPTFFKPQYDIFTSHAQPWDLLDPATPKHSEYP